MHRRFLTVALFLVAISAFAATPRVVPIANGLVAASSSNPSGYLAVGPQVLFVATDAEHGTEVWRSDGTAEGTVLLLDFDPGPSGSGPQMIGKVDGGVVFQVEEATGLSLWRSDGTSAGTWKLGETPRGSGFGYYQAVVPAGSRVFVIVQDDQGAPKEISVSNLTPNSLHPVGSYPLSIFPYAGTDGRLYITGDKQLWVSDGSPLRTGLLQRPVECPGPTCALDPKAVFVVNDTVCFLAADGLWRTDGTSSGTDRIASFTGSELLAHGASAAYIRVGNRLWKTDGSSTGTHELGPHVPFRFSAVLDDGRLLMIVIQSGEYTVRLHEGAGEPVTIGTFEAKEGVGSGPIVGQLGSRVLLRAWDTTHGTELWVIDADARTIQFVADIDPRKKSSGAAESSSPAPGATIGGRVLFSAQSVNGRELWSSGGTEVGTRLVANINPEPGGGVVSGRVVDAAGGAPLPGALVGLCQTENDCDVYTRTSTDGRYRFDGVEPGSYVMVASMLSYFAQFFDGVDCPLCPLGSATPVDVSAGLETKDVDFALQRGGSITGSVRNAATGAPAGGTIISVTDSAGNNVASGQVRADGKYRTSALTTGQYYVQTRALYWLPLINQVYPGRHCIPAPCQASTGEPVSVTSGVDTAGIDFSLNEHQTISGIVRGPDGRPLAQAEVAFFDPRLSNRVSTRTDANGVYHSPQLWPGSYAVMVTATPIYSGVVYPNAACPSSGCDPNAGTAVAVGAEAVTGIDMTVGQHAGVIAGVVLDRNGAPLRGARVKLHDQAGLALNGYSGSGETDVAGRFLYGPLPAGTYYVSAEYELHPNVDCPGNPCNVQGATAFTVTSGATTRVEFRLRSERTTIAGVLTDSSSGTPVGSGGVSLYRADGHVLAHGQSFSAGQYSISAISRETTVFLIGSGDGYHRMAHPGVRVICPQNTYDCVPPGAVAIPAGTRTIDLALDPKGVIRGVVVDAMTGEPIATQTVRFAQNGVAKGYAITDAKGGYRWPDADGSYNVYVDKVAFDRYGGQVYPDRDCPETCDSRVGDLVTAADGASVTGVDFHLRSPIYVASIAGRVVDDETGIGIAGVRVVALGPATAGATTGADGRYIITKDSLNRALPVGEYRLYAADQRHYVALYGGKQCAEFDACERMSGDPVQVTGPGTVSGIDFRMIRMRTQSVTPTYGPPGGGTHIAILGTHFPANATVHIGGVVAQIVRISPSEIVAITPPGSVGSVDVKVGLPSGRASTLAHGFTYASTSARRRSTGR